MSSSNLEWKFLATTAFLVATIAVPTLASLLSPEMEERPALMVRSPEQKTREPASLPHLKGPKKEIVIEDSKKVLSNLLSSNMISYDLRCAGEKVTTYKVEGAYLQLKGKDCGRTSQMPKLLITNQSNGFTASVFQLNAKEYQTDLIQLIEGENQILIQSQFPSGRIEEQVLHVKANTI